MSQPANDDFSQHLSDDEASYHEDASDNGTATNKPKQQQQQLIPTTTTISNIKLPILKKEEYDIWAMEMEHYLEYIDNDVWKVIQNGNSKKRISTGKDGVVRVLPPVSAAEIHAVEKERKARTILLMAIPKEHLRRFHGMDDAKEIWEAIRTRFGGNANSKKMQKAVLKQQFEAFTISSSEGLEKGYDRFQQLLSQLEAHGAEVSTEDANHKFLRSLPPAWSNLAMTMRTKPDVDTLSIDDLYNNLRQRALTRLSCHTVAYSTYTPSSVCLFQTIILEREVPDGFAEEKKRDSFYQDQGAGKKEQNQNCLLTMDDGVVNWGEHTEEEVEANHALMAINSNNEGTSKAEIMTQMTNPMSIYLSTMPVEDLLGIPLSTLLSLNQIIPLKNMEDICFIGSGCSGHMTGNKDHLDDFKECKGGSVTFGGSKGYITD
ncbi:hypothetical protein Tco_0685772 [Tanacetum coccineum]